jgi:hypothetical protein
MPTYTYIVLSNPVEGREAEYNDWYDAVHLPENFTDVAGMKSAQRFKYAAPGVRARKTGESPYGYLAIYEIEADSSEAVEAAFDSARSAGGIPASDAFDMSTVGGWFFEPIGPKLTPGTAPTPRRPSPAG